MPKQPLANDHVLDLREDHPRISQINADSDRKISAICVNLRNLWMTFFLVVRERLFRHRSMRRDSTVSRPDRPGARQPIAIAGVRFPKSGLPRKPESK